MPGVCKLDGLWSPGQSVGYFSEYFGFFPTFLSYFQHCHSFSYFPPHCVSKAELAAYTLSIIRNFDEFRLKLREAQKLLEEKMDWGVPVKPGQHLPGTLDLKIRGREVINMNFFHDDIDSDDKDAGGDSKSRIQAGDELGISRRRSKKVKKTGEAILLEKCVDDDDDGGDSDDFESILQQTVEKKKRKDKSDDDLPELIIVDECNGNDHGIERVDGSKNKDVLSLDSDKDNFEDGNSKMGQEVSGRLTEMSNKLGVGVVDRMIDKQTRTLKGTKVCPEPAGTLHKISKDKERKLTEQEKVLVVDTQDYDVDAVKETVRTCREDMIVAETQNEFVNETKKSERWSKRDRTIVQGQDPILDNDYEFLAVKCTEHGTEFENTMHRTKLLGYQIPRKQKEDSKGKSLDNSNKDNSEDVCRSETGESKFGTEVLKQDLLKPDRELQKHKRKHRKIFKAKSLVEETQDSDKEESTLGGWQSSVKHRRRKSFQLNCASSDEDRCVPESQDSDGSPEIVVKKTLGIRSKSGTCSSKSSTRRNVADKSDKSRKYDESAKSGKEIEDGEKDKMKSNERTERLEDNLCVGSNILKRQHSHQCLDDEESQSPVIIRKQRKLQNTNSQGTNEDPFHVVKGNNHVIAGGNLGVQRNVTAEEFKAKGVRKLFSRPVSNESNVSDASTTSSKVSSTMLDEKGDLYSTQICELKKRKGQKVGETTVVTKNIAEDEVLCIDDSDSDLEVTEVIKGPKTYSRAKQQRSSSPANKDNALSRYFSCRPNVTKSADIDLDPRCNTSQCRLPSIEPSVGIADFGDFEALVNQGPEDRGDIEDPFRDRSADLERAEMPSSSDLSQVDIKMNLIRFKETQNVKLLFLNDFVELFFVIFHSEVIWHSKSKLALS